jgi:GNAT superfamily N-acetyltransferase
MRVPGIGIVGVYRDWIVVASGERAVAPLQIASVRRAQSAHDAGELIDDPDGAAARMRRGDTCLIAEFDRALAGIYWINYGTTQDARLGDTSFTGKYVYANQLFVCPGFRGKGIGQALASAARDHARELGAVVVAAVPFGNIASLKLHRSTGFRVDHRVLGVRIDRRYVRLRGDVAQLMSPGSLADRS